MVLITYVYVRVQRVQGLDRQAERTATLTPASCVLLLLLLLLLCCGRRTSAVDVVHQSSTVVVVAPVTRKKLFLLDKTCEMQIFRPQYIIVLNFNQKTLLDKDVRFCVFLTLSIIPVDIQHQCPC